MVKSTIVRDEKSFFNMLISAEVQVNRVLVINEEVLVVSWEYSEELRRDAR
jgi:hypothetical protein